MACDPRRNASPSVSLPRSTSLPAISDAASSRRLTVPPTLASCAASRLAARTTWLRSPSRSAKQEVAGVHRRPEQDVDHAQARGRSSSARPPGRGLRG